MCTYVVESKKSFHILFTKAYLLPRMTKPIYLLLCSCGTILLLYQHIWRVSTISDWAVLIYFRARQLCLDRHVCTNVTWHSTYERRDSNEAVSVDSTWTLTRRFGWSRKLNNSSSLRRGTNYGQHDATKSRQIRHVLATLVWVCTKFSSD